MRNIFIKLAYDGTNYCGWQVQPNENSICDELIRAIYAITKEKPVIYGSGRTDSGVHAYAQTANFFLNSQIPSEKLIGALNAKLPKDIVINELRDIDDSFNARYCAIGKEYQYNIYNSQFMSPFYVNRSWHVRGTLDIDAMKKAGEVLVGEYDFSAFMSSGSSIKSTVRTIYKLDINAENEIITVSVYGNGFLYNMVRIIVGTLVFVGQSRLTPSDVKEILDGCDRTKGAVTAPAEGLFLKQVLY